MSRYTIFAVIAALCLATTHAAVTTGSLTTATFNQPPGVVFQGATGAADETTWGTYTGAVYGPGTANTTVYAYGVKGSPVTAVASRSLNATLLSNGTAATAAADAKIADVVSGTVSYAAGYKVGVGLGSIAIVHIKSEGTVACPQLYIDIYNGGTAGAISSTKITSNTCQYCVASPATNGIGIGLTINSVFYENSTYYVAYTTVTWVSTGGSGSACTATLSTVPALPDGTSAKTDTTALTGTLQGFAAASTASTKWTTAPNWFSQAAAASPTIAYADLLGQCGPSNYTNSTTFYCAYGNSASPKVWSYIPITVASGTAGSSGTLATGTALSGSTYPQTIKVYTVGGFIYSLYQQGIIVNLDTRVYTTSSAYTSTHTLQIYNLTSGATSTTGAVDGGIAISGYSNTNTAGAYTGQGLTYGTGYGLLTQYTSDASSTSYELAAYFANGTINGTKTTYASGSPYISTFVDANGALWAGGYSIDTYLQTGTLGKLVAQIYSSGNVLVSFFALLSIMIAALFAF